VQDRKKRRRRKVYKVTVKVVENDCEGLWGKISNAWGWAPLNFLPQGISKCQVLQKRTIGWPGEAHLFGGCALCTIIG